MQNSKTAALAQKLTEAKVKKLLKGVNSMKKLWMGPNSVTIPSHITPEQFTKVRRTIGAR